MIFIVEVSLRLHYFFHIHFNEIFTILIILNNAHGINFDLIQHMNTAIPTKTEFQEQEKQTVFHIFPYKKV